MVELNEKALEAAIDAYVDKMGGFAEADDPTIVSDILTVYLTHLPAPDNRIGAGWEKHSIEDKRRLQSDAGIPHLPTDLTYEARLAVSGAGPRAYEWSDKKHRLVYDLCREIERIAATTRQLGETT